MAAAGLQFEPLRLGRGVCAHELHTQHRIEGLRGSGWPVFPRLWRKSDPADAARMTAAATSLALERDETGKSVGILTAARESAKSDTERLGLEIALAEALNAQKKGAEMLPIALSLRERYPESETAFGLQLLALKHLKRYEEIAKLVDQWIARVPGEPYAYNMGAAMAGAAGDLARAVELRKKLIAQGHADTIQLNSLAWEYLMEGKHMEEALDAGRRAVTAAGQKPIPGVLHTLACIYAEVGKTAEARETMIKGMDVQGLEEPTEIIWYVFGRIAEQYGLNATARSYYEKLKAPKSEDPLSTWVLAQRRLAAMK